MCIVRVICEFERHKEYGCPYSRETRHRGMRNGLSRHTGRNNNGARQGSSKRKQAEYPCPQRTAEVKRMADL